MTAHKAIEILELNIRVAGMKMPPDTLNALKLHVESMKRLMYARLHPGCDYTKLLPGEN